MNTQAETAALEAAMSAIRALAAAGTLHALACLGDIAAGLDSEVQNAVDVHRAKNLPTSWASIGDCFGLSRQGAQQRFSA